MYIDITNIALDEVNEFKLSKKGEDSLFGERNINFVSDIGIEGVFIVRKDYVNINADIMFALKAKCERCLEESEWNLCIKFNEEFTRNQSNELYTFKENKVELDRAINENILLNIPSLILCKEDCKGICPKCGCDLNSKECDCKNTIEDKNPFAILKTIVGGSKEDGSTKK